MNGQGHTVAITARQQFYCIKSSLCSRRNFSLPSTFHSHLSCALPRASQSQSHAAAAFRVVQTIQQLISSATEKKAATNTLKKN